MATTPGPTGPVPVAPAPAAAQYLLDTNILVACIRTGPLGRYVERTYPVRSAMVAPLICVVSVGEILAFGRKRNWGAHETAEMPALLAQLVIVDINSAAVLDGYAEIDHAAGSCGPALGKNDLDPNLGRGL